MDSSANQWLAELESDDLGGLEFIDPLSMQQLAESLANELWNEPPQEQQQEQHEQPQQCNPSPTGFSFMGDLDLNNANGRCPTAVVSSAGGSDNMFSFTANSLGPLHFTNQESWRESVPTGSAVGKCCSSSTTEKKSSGRKPSSSVKEHVIAERKRREKMHHQFSTLASIIPDITKTDKVSVLGSTIEYLQYLRNRLKALQEKYQYSSSTAESPTSLNARCCIGTEDDDGAVRPKIEADVQGTTVLLRVVCQVKKGVLIMVLTELEKHRLSIINTNVVPFAKSALNITITAQIEDGSSTTVELVNNLSSALKKF
ncbi:unnamed protein product [Urochloa humidicola]